MVKSRNCRQIAAAKIGHTAGRSGFVERVLGRKMAAARIGGGTAVDEGVEVVGRGVGGKEVGRLDPHKVAVGEGVCVVVKKHPNCFQN